jgi:hypothetical protein
MDNYPDDIRQYDSHPGSPFYREPACRCGKVGKSDCGEDEECGPDWVDDREPPEDDWE